LTSLIHSTRGGLGFDASTCKDQNDVLADSGLTSTIVLSLDDMIMMSRQLLNLKKLSEQTYHTSSE